MKEDICTPPAKRIRTTRFLVECFTADVLYNGRKTGVVFVPLGGRPHGWVGPGYWSGPPYWDPQAIPSSYKYNTRVYTREELVNAGAKQKFEYLWTR